MVASANDACNVIAQYVSGSISDFVARMNARAAELGCTGTNFTNTHGLPDANHYTTAWDFSRIVREAAKHELFMTIASTINYTVPDTNVSSERVLESTNSLVNPTNPLYPGDWGYEYAKGIKTGHTNDAGYCLASSAEKGRREAPFRRAQIGGVSAGRRQLVLRQLCRHAHALLSGASTTSAIRTFSNPPRP